MPMIVKEICENMNVWESMLLKIPGDFLDTYFPSHKKNPGDLENGQFFIITFCMYVSGTFWHIKNNFHMQGASVSNVFRCIRIFCGAAVSTSSQQPFLKWKKMKISIILRIKFQAEGG